MDQCAVITLTNYYVCGKICWMMNKQRHIFIVPSVTHTPCVRVCCVAPLYAPFTKRSSEIDWFYAIKLKMSNNVMLFKAIAFTF